MDGLKIDPCIPSDNKGYTVDRTYRGVTYHITVDNKAGVEKGVASVTVNGTPVAGNIIAPPADGTKELNVVVTMG